MLVFFWDNVTLLLITGVFGMDGIFGSVGTWPDELEFFFDEDEAGKQVQLPNIASCGIK